MAYKEGSGLKCEVAVEVKDGRLVGKIVCKKITDGKVEGESFTEPISIAGADDMTLSILGGRLKVDFMEAFNAFNT